MATITPSALSGTGSDVTLAAASGGGDSIANAKKAFLLVNNGNGGAVTVTFAGSIECNQGATHNVAVAVAAGKVRHIPVPGQAINETTGAAAVTYSTTTSVTVAAYK